MSGKRRITVDEAQWNALQQRARQLKELKRNAPRLVADLRRQTQADLARVSAQLEDRQRAVMQTMSALSDQTRALETETHRQLTDQAAQMRRQLAENAGKLRAQTDVALAEQQRAWRAELSAERDRQRAALAELRDEFHDQSQAAAETAQAWLHDAGLMQDLIHDQLPHERYAPGELATLSKRLAAARDTFRQGHSESALALAQQVCHELSDLRVEIQHRESEWTKSHAFAYEAALELDGMAAENATQTITAGTEGNDTAVDFDVDHWSEGELSGLRSDIAALLAQLGDGEAPLGTGQLRDVIDTRVPELKQRLTDVVQRAEMRLRASQQRINVADIVVQTLDDIAGYQVEDHAYELMDMRRTFFAKLLHPNGNEIVVSVAPSTDESGQYVLRLLNYDYDTASQAELDERAAAVTGELQARGLNVNDQGCEPGEPEPIDFRRIRQARPVQAAASADTPSAQPAS